ncbi:hypothetical protein [Xanthobacter agilis]|uniref:hypothetical protein n=1 Tax=Xanthobacter agilis TaxID=47492 RepID=UPI00372C5D9F
MIERGRRIAWRRIADESLWRAPAIVARWLPDGRREGAEWVARNPTRADHRLGNFKVNLSSGRWADFATGDAGGDLISLAAFLFTGGNMAAAAVHLAEMIGISAYE